MKTKLPYQSWKFVIALWLFCDSIGLAQQTNSLWEKAKEETNLYRKNWGKHEASLAKILHEIKVEGISPYSDYLGTRFGVSKRDAKNPAVMGIGSKSFGEYLSWLESARLNQDVDKEKRKVYESFHRTYNSGLAVDFEFTPGFVLQGRHLYGPNNKDKKRYDIVWLRASDGTVLNGRICRVEGGNNLLPGSSDITNMRAAANLPSFKASVEAYKSSNGTNRKSATSGKPSILVANNTDRVITLRKVTVKSPKKSYTAKNFSIPPQKNHKIGVSGIDVRSTSYELVTKFGDISLTSTWSSVGIGDRKIDIGFDDLPIVRKQKEFQTWHSTSGHRTKAKFVDRIEKDNGTHLRLLKEDGKTVDVPVEQLTATGKRFSREIADGSHELLWQVGTKKIRPQHLVGKNVLLVMYRYLDNSGELGNKPMEKAYGPFVQGVVLAGNDEFLQMNCTYKMVQVGLTGRKVAEETLKDYKIQINGRGIENNRGIQVGDAIIESVVVDGLMYRPVRNPKKPTFFELGQSRFWNTVAKGEEPKVTFDKHERSAKMSRKGAAGVALLGAFWVSTKALGLKAQFESQDCVIQGKTYPNTVVKFGRLSYSDKCRSDSQGNYRFVIPSFVKPSSGERYKLAIEQNGKTVELWSGELNSIGVNAIDLFNP